MEEWKKYRLGDVCTISSSKRIFASEYQSIGIPFYRGKEIIEKQRGANISNELYISKSRYNEIENKFGVPKKGDMLLTSVGTLGIPYIVKDEVFYFKDGNLTWFYSFDSINNEYLYYWFLSPIAKHQIDTKAIGSTQKALTIEVLNKFDITLPPRELQSKIVNILSSLDNKIALNRRINDNLEQQAQALYKSWFVDFEPFNGGKFIDSELGRIPEGWRVGSLEDLIIVKYGKDHKRLRDGDIPVYGSGGIMRYVDDYLYSGESVLIPRKGSLNNVFYINDKFWSVDTMFYTQMRQENIAKFVYFFVLSQNLSSMNAGSAVPSMTVDILNGLKCVIVPLNIMAQFNTLQTPIFDEMKKNMIENGKLSQFRDSLLPKLMSGELKISDLNS
ncbi:type I restriction enzyme S subunit [Parabacteroides sp. PFB2-10]|uniref:restriction endonuclease subunit S n=1 Tax=Parabacteroides sp. PFB2-10 TaxID=1742405 RepID=UPI0024748A8F|nr:restriction endonuclease subunit S [Parabacteroides sp. PFB2-10]MDH6312671.1 type I restriction enzyme S subunit [Parabacteroides sp. PFB2-10]